MPSAAASGEYNGHFYEVIAYPSSGHPDKSWLIAKTAAEMRVYESINGHLATITSAGEDAFIESLRVLAGLHPSEAWVGGFQSSPPCGSSGCNWTWENGEGAFIYTNWQDGEPNDNGGVEEQYLGIGLGNIPGWNDERVLGNIGGYVVEYDVPVDATACVSGIETCPLSVGSDIDLPDTVELTGMATIDTRRYEFTDDPTLCGTTTRLLFGEATDPEELIPDVLLPAYLCGSPKFLVIVANAEGITLPSGTIEVTNNVLETFPNNLFDCTGPYDTNLFNPDDPQNRDVVAYQKTNLEDMPENELGMMHGFEGSVAEVNFECGSSRGKTNDFSYYFVGLHIDFGPLYADFAGNPDGVRDEFARLTRYKLHVLQDVILESRIALRDNFFQRLGHRVMRHLARAAIIRHDQGRYSAARFRLKLIDWWVQNLTYTEIQGENYQGETEMRNSNGIFMYTDKVIQ